MSKSNETTKFDREYYDRFYRRPETRASTPADFKRVAAFVLHYLAYLEVPVRSVLDLGCGLGRWRDYLKTHDPRIRYTGVEVSPYLCREFGWTRASAVDFRSKRKYDLVICQDVLPYLSRREIASALANVAAHCRGAAYIQLITREDWDNDIVDPGRTDPSMNRFEAAWYRKAIGRHFINCGGGLFVPRDGDTPLWEMEKL